MMRAVLLVVVMLSMATVALADDTSVGKQVYDTRCAFCHGATGAGDGPAGSSLQPPPTNFTKPAYWSGASANDATIRDIVAKGKPGTAMVPFGTTLTPQELDAVVAYVKSFKPKN